MRSIVTDAVIPNNVPVHVGTSRLAVRWVDPEPPVTVEVIVMPHRHPDSAAHQVALGGTFPVGAETWRFDDLHLPGDGRSHGPSQPPGTEFQVLVRRVDGGEPPPLPVPRLRPFGRLDEERLEGVERWLGFGLPPAYRRWLASTNGLRPDGAHHVTAVRCTLTPNRPLLGVHPLQPAFDLLTANREHRDAGLPAGHLVIAAPKGGLLIAAVADRQADSIWFLPRTARSGPADPATRPIHVGGDIDQFVGRLRLVYPNGELTPTDDEDPYRRVPRTRWPAG